METEYLQEDERREKEAEQLAENLHKWYLEATANLHPESFNPNAQKQYADLTEEQKFIDRYIADKCLIEARKQLAEREWIPVSERLPEPGQWVLVACAARLTEDGWERADGEADIAPLESMSDWQHFMHQPSTPP